MIAIIHHNDHDGFCSAAIVSHFEKNNKKEFFCSDYTTPILDLTKDKKYEKIYVVDISFDLKTMKELKNRCDNIIWIDHHQSAMEKLDEFEADGIRKIGKSACRLCWEYLFPEEKIPYGVKLIDKFDIFDNSNEKLWDNYVYPFKLGMECYDMQPDDNIKIWNKIFKDDETFLKDTVNKGKTINKYLSRQFKKIAEETSFEIKFEGKNAVVVNTPFFGSFSVDPVYDPKKHDIMMVFKYSKDKYSVSLYTTKRDVDVAKIAEKYGGGGHKKAAGFSCKQLPFKLPNK